ncbi:hypothetical protein FA13DRAFT_1770243 [Coprinellus micaceus]|uniref:Copper transport protein n=1 Tax=Coprinellus micaceus TaxID=71717 RepID=A0A4Y7TZ84_COPMI|nr:hypothetical protein FA13DRAFT_1770243 [Coprinellus micaceus]
MSEGEPPLSRRCGDKRRWWRLWLSPVAMNLAIWGPEASTHGPALPAAVLLVQAPLDISNSDTYTIKQIDLADHDTSSTSTSTASSGHDMMTPYLHFNGGDYLYFSAWQPNSPGAIVGACVGLFMLALFERWFGSLRAVFEHHWKHRALLLSSKFSARSEGTELLATGSRTDKSTSTGTQEKELEASVVSVPPLVPRLRIRTIPPFVPSQDIPRGIMYAFHMFVGYLLMLAVMLVLFALFLSIHPAHSLADRTFHAGYIISIVVGLGVGEVAFGRTTCNLAALSVMGPLVCLLFGWFLSVRKPTVRISERVPTVAPAPPCSLCRSRC